MSRYATVTIHAECGVKTYTCGTINLLDEIEECVEHENGMHDIYGVMVSWKGECWFISGQQLAEVWS
jgi:hypothetical protein